MGNKSARVGNAKGGGTGSGGSGTVTSIGISSTDLSVSGSPVTTAGTITLNVNNNAIAYAKMQAVSGTSKLLGSSSTTTPVQEITISTGLSLSGTTLTATAVSAPIQPSTQIAFGNGVAPYVGSADFIYDSAGIFNVKFSNNGVFLNDLTASSFQWGDINNVAIADGFTYIEQVSNIAGHYPSTKIFVNGQFPALFEGSNSFARITLGDNSGTKNNTLLIVDDATQSYSLNKLGGGTGVFVTADNSGTLGTSPFPTGGISATTYTPTLTNTTNVTSSTAKNCTYTRIGNIVTVTGSLGIVTTLAVSTVIEISLPIASNIGALTDLNGLGSAASAIATNVVIEGEVTNNTAKVSLIALSVGGSGNIFFTFSYSVI